jgi:hypothetical protein
MNIRSNSSRNVLGLLAALVAVLVLGLAPASAVALRSDANPHVLPPAAHPYGQSYGEWAADWWQWALSQPVSTNPVLDETGANCAAGQSGLVWFLAGTFGGSATRSCTVPTGKALLLPVLNNAYFAFESDPPEQRTEEFVRGQVSFFKDAVTSLSATIDGVSVANIKERYFAESPLFTVVLPADNLFGLPEGFVLDPSVDVGYYLMVEPLAPGEHTIHFAGALPGFSIDVTYAITVAR